MTFGSRMEKLYDLPTPADVAHMPMLLALMYMILIDCKRPFQISFPRLRALGFISWVASFFGFLRTRDAKMEGGRRRKAAFPTGRNRSTCILTRMPASAVRPAPQLSRR